MCHDDDDGMVVYTVATNHFVDSVLTVVSAC